MSTEKRKLTHKQNEFVKEYLINGNNGKQAAIKAGYKEDNAVVIASENLSKPNVIAEIEARRIEITEKAESEFSFSVEKRLQWLDEIRQAGLEEYYGKDGAKRRENLSASVSSIKEMNAMLGINSDTDTTIQPIGKIEIEVIGANVKD